MLIVSVWARIGFRPSLTLADMVACKEAMSSWVSAHQDVFFFFFFFFAF